LKNATGKPRLGSGFTVLELMVTLAIGAILAAIAAPGLSSYANENRLRSASSQLLSDINFARLEAIKRNSRVLVCARNAAGTGCSTANDWANGWLVCYDGNGDDVCDPTTPTDPNPLKVAGAASATLQLTATRALIRFNPVGSAAGAATLTFRGTWAASGTRTATVAATGSITSTKN
jgi:type IV fimbrial biogenesis protein FimT